MAQAVRVSPIISPYFAHERAQTPPTPGPSAQQQHHHHHPHDNSSASSCTAQDDDASPRDMVIFGPDAAILDEFRQFTARHSPVGLLATATREALRKCAAERLRRAKAAGVQTRQLVFGRDCLVDWEGRAWDDGQETVLSYLGRELADRWFSDHLGGLVGGDVFAKGSRRLLEAQECGVHLDRIEIGPDLLPVWDGESRHETHVDSQCPVAGSNPKGQLQKHDDAATPRESVRFDLGSDTLDSEDSASDEESGDESTESTVDGDTGDGTPSSTDDIFDDETMEPGSDLNLLRCADLIGLRTGAPPAEVDLEVYLAQGDDDEVMALPELQLGVDRAAFEYHFDVGEEAIDVEFEGFEVIFSEEAVMSHAVDESPEDVEDNRNHYSSATEPEPAQEEETMSEEDENNNAVIGSGGIMVETEEGFAW